MGQDTPKYINTGDTLIYNKRNNLYALNMIKGKKFADLIMVEGYMDVISLHQAGIGNAVASLGTALTQQQARLIKRYVPRVYISYDGDSAGQNATLRGLDTLQKEGLEVRVIRIPGGMDPDDYVRREGREAYLSLRDSALTLNAYKLEYLAAGLDLGTEDGREAYAKKACDLVGRLQPVEQERYIPVIARRAGLPAEAVRAQCGLIKAPSGNSNVKTRNTTTREESRKSQGKREKTEQLLLCAMMMDKSAAIDALGLFGQRRVAMTARKAAGLAAILAGCALLCWG